MIPIATFFLVVIYITFIGLGLPDSILGAAWPAMYGDLHAGIGTAGVIAMVVSASTVTSSLVSDRVIRRFGTGRVTFVSVLATAAALMGFSFVGHYGWLLLLAAPLGLGAGAVDAGLNNYVALHYKPHHMSWLHCFWGIGAFAGPLLTSFFLQQGGNWRGGYRTVALVQLGIVALLLFTLPLWKRTEPAAETVDQATAAAAGSLLGMAGVKPAMAAFLCYSLVEGTVMSWGASYLVTERGLDAAAAARYVSVFFLGLTLGRFFTGLLTLRFSNRFLIRLGQGMSIGGAVLLLLPGPDLFLLCGLVIIGAGCAPIFPCMLHETPRRFGRVFSQKIMGLQMATGYTAGTLMPLLIGGAGSRAGFFFIPPLLLAGDVLMLVLTERVNQVVDRRGAFD